MGFYRCYCLLFLACRVFALSCQYICAIVVILFALSWVISVQQFTKFLRFRNSSQYVAVSSNQHCTLCLSLTTHSLTVRLCVYIERLHIYSYCYSATDTDSATSSMYCKYMTVMRWLHLRFERATSIRRPIRHDRTPTGVRVLLRCGLNK